MRVLSVAAALVLVTAMVVLVVAPASASGNVTLVASGLDSPRGVAVSKGRILVGEAGHGGDVCDPGPPLNCIGLSSRISSVDPRTGQHRAVVSGLFSSLLFGTEPIGVDGVSVRDGNTLAILGEYPQGFASIQCGPTSPPDCSSVLAGARAQAGHLISVAPSGTWRSLASVGEFGFDYTANIPGQEHDANPYGVLAVAGGAYVADAGANTLNFVSNSGKISVVHYFHFVPPAGAFPTDAVPTCVVRAQGHLWVADLSGRLFRLDGASATQVAVVDRSGKPLIRHVTGCATGGDDDGVIYLVNMWTSETFPSPNTGSVVRFKTDEGRASVIADQLNFPNQLAVGPGGALYVSANSVCPATGGPPAECGFMGQTTGLLLKIAPPSQDDGEH